MGLPPKEAFSSHLNLSDILDIDYQHALKVYDALECRDLGDSHDWYLCNGVLLLADVFENFRDTCQEKYVLDPAYFLVCAWFGLGSSFETYWSII